MAQIAAPDSAGSPAETHQFEFRGSGNEYFRIWIVNLALTVLTLGIYSAWAKVRSRRYFNGNTFVAGHSFDYHASPLRILFGRVIALAILLGYSLTAAASPVMMAGWILLFIIALPWLVRAALRFNARYTSYRNIRFNFTGRYLDAAKVYLLWPLAGILTLGLLMPLARRARDYYLINYHTYGGKPFHCAYSGWSLYAVYLLAAVLFLAFFVVLVVIVFMFIGMEQFGTAFGNAEETGDIGAFSSVIFFYVLFLGFAITIGTFIQTMVFNLAIGNTSLDRRHTLDADLRPLPMIWIALSNILLVLVTLGIYYPWARVRVARYTVGRLSLNARSGLDEVTADIAAERSAIGEEIAGFFDIELGL